jgi:hypothetical protein
MTAALNINELNKHERDALIEFDAGPHKYTCAGEADYMSVTTWLHSHFKQFDSNAIIKKMMSNQERFKKSPYYGQTPEQIKAQWDKGRDEAAAAGTAMHAAIERWALHPEEDNSAALSPHFLAFLKDHPDFKPYRAEWMIFHEEIRLAGSIDMIVVGGLRPPNPPLRASPSPNSNGSKKADALERGGGADAQEGVEGGLLSPLGVQGVTSVTLFDWKRCKEIKKTNSFGEFALTECIDHLPDTNYWHYALQLNTYKAILEAKYDKKVEKMVLVCLHPNLPTYQLLTVPDLSNEIAALFALRKTELARLL